MGTSTRGVCAGQEGAWVADVLFSTLTFAFSIFFISTSVAISRRELFSCASFFSCNILRRWMAILRWNHEQNIVDVRASLELRSMVIPQLHLKIIALLSVLPEIFTSECTFVFALLHGGGIVTFGRGMSSNPERRVVDPD